MSIKLLRFGAQHARLRLNMLKAADMADFCLVDVLRKIFGWDGVRRTELRCSVVLRWSLRGGKAAEKEVFGIFPLSASTGLHA